MILKFLWVLSGYQGTYVRAKFHRAQGSGSGLIVVMEKKKLRRKQYSPLLLRGQ